MKKNKKISRYKPIHSPADGLKVVVKWYLDLNPNSVESNK